MGREKRVYAAASGRGVAIGEKAATYGKNRMQTRRDVQARNARERQRMAKITQKLHFFDPVLKKLFKMLDIAGGGVYICEKLSKSLIRFHRQPSSPMTAG